VSDGGETDAGSGPVLEAAELDRLGEALADLRLAIRERHRAVDRPRRTGADWMRLIEVARRRINALWMIESSPDVDDFGGDATAQRAAGRVLDFLVDVYWRVEVVGAPAAPSEGPVVYVANGSGLLPWDGLVLAHLTGRVFPEDRAAERPRLLLPDWLMTTPFVQPRLTQIGAVRACPENADRLLASGRSIVVFPEGAQGASKTWAERHGLKRFGRGGAIRTALRNGVPLRPVGLVGAGEVHPLLARLPWPGRLAGLPFVPVTPTFPWLGLAGLIPLPSRWVVCFGAPVDLRELPPEDARDDARVAHLNESLRAEIQGLVDRALERREALEDDWPG